MWLVGIVYTVLLTASLGWLTGWRFIAAYALALLIFGAVFAVSVRVLTWAWGDAE